MGIARELYQLQEVDLEIEAAESALREKSSQLGESEAYRDARAKLTSEQQRLNDLKKQLHSSEGEIEDLTEKITVIDGKLYGGKIRNPKELTDLQHEGNALKAKRSQLETKVLENMDQIESAEVSLTNLNRAFQQVERDWQGEQKQLAVEIEELKTRLADLKAQREQVSESIEAGALALYNKLRKQKGQALARIEQGICRGCRISLSFNEIQQARASNLVQCSSCGRILYLP